MVKEKLSRAGTNGLHVLLHAEVLEKLGARVGDVFDATIDKELTYTMGGLVPFPQAVYTMKHGAAAGGAYLGVPPKWLRYHGLKELDFVGVEVKGHRLILSKVEG